MADSSIDYTVVLADLRAKRDQLESAIAAIEAMLGMTASAPGHAPAGTPATGGELGPGAFLGMSIVDATVKLLSIRRQQTRTEDIASALKQGGIAFSSDNPANTVGSVLNRNFTQGGEIVRVGRGVWGLAEWFDAPLIRHAALMLLPSTKRVRIAARGFVDVLLRHSGRLSRDRRESRVV